MIDDTNQPYNDIPQLSPEEQARIEKTRGVIGFIRSKYENAKLRRNTTEQTWLDCHRANRGEYSPEERARMEAAEKRNPGNSKVFVKVTKTKVEAAYGQILELLDDSSGFPIGVEPTPVPEGIADVAHVTLNPNGVPQTTPQDAQTPPPEMGSPYGFEGDGNNLEPGATTSSVLRGLADRWNKFLKGKGTVESGSADDPQTQITITPAEESARKLQKVLQDQLTETHAMTALRRTTKEMVILGTGCLKGVFSYEETIHRFDQDPISKKISYNPFRKLVPRIEHVSVWNIFPDYEAETPNQIEWVIQRHLLGKSRLKDLANEPFFDKDALGRICNRPAKSGREYWENYIVDNPVDTSSERYEVLEYWGFLTKELAQSMGLEFPETLDILQVNVWICEDEVLRIILNPFLPQRIPYYFVPYEEHLYQIWGIGVPENMKDTQSLMNGHMRMAIDNLRYAGSVILEVNENQLVPNQDLTLYPGKIFRKQGGAPGQSIYGITFPNTSPSHLQMYDKARQLADEQTFPSYSHGQTGVTGTTRTAAGMGMLFSAAAQNIKTVVSNFEHYLLRPLGENLFYWNMQFNEQNVEIRGDYKIVATGVSSLMKKEILTQRLLQFLQVGASNQATAPMLNYEYILKKIAESLDLDPDKVVNDLDKARMYAMIMQMSQQQNQGTPPSQPGQAAPSGEGTTSPSPSDMNGSGNGNIGAGAPQMPQQ